MTDHTRDKLIARISALPPGSIVGAEHVPCTLTREEWLETLRSEELLDQAVQVVRNGGLWIEMVTR